MDGRDRRNKTLGRRQNQLRKRKRKSEICITQLNRAARASPSLPFCTQKENVCSKIIHKIGGLPVVRAPPTYQFLFLICNSKMYSISFATDRLFFSASSFTFSNRSLFSLRVNLLVSLMLIYSSSTYSKSIKSLMEQLK